MEAFQATTHGQLACEDCHGGVPTATDKEAAHEGMVHDPSEDPEASCGGCHEDTVESGLQSMHYNLTGEHYWLEQRLGGSMEDYPEFHEGYDGECAACHATCGQCHVSRPKSAGSGFIAGHVFNRTPDMINQCTACHGSRVGEEYRGVHRDEIPGYKADVHYLNSMRCEDCHVGAEMHGGGDADHRVDMHELPRCEDCHADKHTANDYHIAHWGELSCHSCHSQDYKNCASCHSPSGLDGSSWLAFKIGKNPLPESRPYEYVTLRHAPAIQDGFEGWGHMDGLPEFDSVPTWKYAAPHNIQRWTDRTTVEEGQGCYESCHNTPATEDGWFLRSSDLEAQPEVANANAPYIVPDTDPLQWD